MTTPFFPTTPMEPAVSTESLSKAQKLFNTLIKKIEILQTLLVVWRDDMPHQSERHRREYAPLFRTYTLLRVELIKVLDRASVEIPLSANERKKLRQLIPSITAELMIEQPSDAIKALHDKYSDIGYDAQNEEVDDAVMSMLGDVLGVGLNDDVDFSNLEQLPAVSGGEKTQGEHKPIHPGQYPFDAYHSEGKKFVRQAEHEQQRVEAVQLKKSLQAVFRKLVAALHPDRAPDDGERERRTELMQRVNVAYENKDLLQLLELQVQIELGGKRQLGAQSDEHLQHYNKILKKQCELLMHALAEAQQPFRSLLGITALAELSTKAVLAQMQHDIQKLKSSIAALQHDLSLLHDAEHLKTWLRDYQIPKEPEFDEFIGLSSMSPFGSR